MQRPLLWALAILFVVFVVGMTAGRTVGLRTRGPMPQPPAAPGMMADVIEQLELASDQRARVDEILRRRNEQTDSILDGATVGLRAIIDSASREIRAVLGEEQRVRFDSLLAAERSGFRIRQPMRSPSGNR